MYIYIYFFLNKLAPSTPPIYKVGSLKKQVRRHIITLKSPSTGTDFQSHHSNTEAHSSAHLTCALRVEKKPRCSSRGTLTLMPKWNQHRAVWKRASSKAQNYSGNSAFIH